MDKMLSKIEGSIGYLIFNNPEKHNAVSLEMWDATDAILDEFESNSDIRVVVLTGAGGKSFVSGADISKFEKERGSAEATKHYNARIRAIYERIAHFPKPTIAQVDGYCIGGGLNLAVCCDIRICSKKSKFAMPAAKLALGYPFPAIQRLINAIGASNAKYLMFTAERIDAETAYRMGFVQAVHDESTLEQEVASLASQIGNNAPLTVKAMKYIATQVLSEPQHRDLDHCDELVDACFTSDDYKEGRTAFMEKRAPQFKGC
jgi:enoyl-CoA hydratase/carnithine racemase